MKKLLIAASVMMLALGITPKVDIMAEPLPITEASTSGNDLTTSGEIIASQKWYVDREGNLIPVTAKLSAQEIEARELTDIFGATFYYTGIEDGYKHYKVKYSLKSLEAGRYYTSSTINVTPKNSSSTHSNTSTWKASAKKTIIEDEIEYWYTKNPPADPGVTVSCTYNTTKGAGIIQPHMLTNPVDIS